MLEEATGTDMVSVDTGRKFRSSTVSTASAGGYGEKGDYSHEETLSSLSNSVIKLGS